MASEFNQPLSGFVVPRYGGIPTFMRLPHVEDPVDGVVVDRFVGPLPAGERRPHHLVQLHRASSLRRRPPAADAAGAPVCPTATAAPQILSPAQPNTFPPVGAGVRLRE